MGCCFSDLLFPVAVDSDTASLQRRIRDLEQQLGGGGQHGNGAAAATSAGHGEVLFFPDPGMPCRYGAACRRPNCDYAHGATSLTRLIAVLSSARRSVSVAVFSLTCDEIADALLALHRKGVKVRLITDDEQVASAGSDAATCVSRPRMVSRRRGATRSCAASTTNPGSPHPTACRWSGSGHRAQAEYTART